MCSPVMRPHILYKLPAFPALPGSPFSLMRFSDMCYQPAGRKASPALPAHLPRPVDLHDVEPEVKDVGSADGATAGHVGRRQFYPVLFLDGLPVSVFGAPVHGHCSAGVFWEAFRHKPRLGGVGFCLLAKSIRNGHQAKCHFFAGPKSQKDTTDTNSSPFPHLTLPDFLAT